MKLDCHVHSIFSDGRLTPLEILQEADKLGLTHLTITDHDNMNSYDDLIRESKNFKIQIIPGVEITAIHEDNEMHILGYGCDRFNNNLLAHFEHSKKERDARALKMFDMLSSDFNINLDLIKMHSQYKFVERSAIAREISIIENISHREAADKYISRNGACYVKPYSAYHSPISAKEAVELIHQAGGVAVLAHPKDPYLHERSYEEIISVLKDFNFDGVEAEHTRLSEEQTMTLLTIADKLGIFTTAGSDCHGIKNSKDEYAIGTKYITEEDKAFEILSSKKT